MARLFAPPLTRRIFVGLFVTSHVSASLSTVAVSTEVVLAGKAVRVALPNPAMFAVFVLQLAHAPLSPDDLSPHNTDMKHRSTAHIILHWSFRSQWQT